MLVPPEEMVWLHWPIYVISWLIVIQDMVNSNSSVNQVNYSQDPIHSDYYVHLR